MVILNALTGAIRLNIEDLEISVRTYNALKSLHINTLADITAFTYRELLKAPNVGKKTMDEIEELMQKYDLKLKHE